MKENKTKFFYYLTILLVLLILIVPLNLGKSVTEINIKSHSTLPSVEDSDITLLDEGTITAGQILLKFKYQENIDVSTPEKALDEVKKIINNGNSFSFEQVLSAKPILSNEMLIKNKDKKSENGLDRWILINLEENVDIYSEIEKYKSKDQIEIAEPNYVYNNCTIPNDIHFFQQWALNQDNNCDIDGPEAWDITVGSPDVTIAVTDTGVDYRHNDLKDNIWINSGEDLNNDGDVDLSDFNDVDDDGNGFIDDIRGWCFAGFGGNNVMDYDGHGTHCAGIAGAKGNNLIGVAGVTWNCRIMPVKISNFGISTEEIFSQGIIYAADNGADVVSMSYGSRAKSDLLEDAVNYAYQEGTVLVAAAGNENSDEKSYPAGFTNVIGVGATNENDVLPFFTNWGDWIDVYAPGVDIISTSNSIDKYKKHSGTSMACPHVAGVAALLLSDNSSLTNQQVKTRIRNSVDFRYVRKRINAYSALSGSPGRPSIPYCEDIIFSGQTGVEYSFSTEAIDPDGDKLYFKFDWDDGESSGWVGPVDSGKEIKSSHTWSKKGIYNVKVKAKDSNDYESKWSLPNTFRMKSKSKVKNFDFIYNLLEIFSWEQINQFVLLKKFI